MAPILPHVPNLAKALSDLPLFAGKQVAVTPLSARPDAHVYLVASDSLTATLKLYCDSPNASPLRRAKQRAAAEAGASRLFAPTGLAPQLLWQGDLPAAPDAEAVLLTHVDAEPIGERPLSQVEADLYADALRLVHSGPSDLTLASPNPRNLEAWWEHTHELYRELPPDLLEGLPPTVADALARLVQSVAADAQAHKRFWQTAAPTPVHGRATSDNLIIVGDQATLLDWEDFGLGDPAYEVASAACRLTRSSGAEQARQMVARYLDGRDDDMLARRIEIYSRLWPFGHFLSLLTSFRESDNPTTQVSESLAFYLRACLETYGMAAQRVEAAMDDLVAWASLHAEGEG